MDSEQKMFTGDWKCSGCGGAITQLPFEPDPSRTNELLCRDCHSKKREERKQNRPMFQGDWKCSKCNGQITELPFEPDPARANELTCRSCYMQR